MDTLFHYFGIDVSKDSLQIATQDKHQNWSDSKISNEIDAINQWIDQLPTESRAFVVLEYTGTYSSRLTHCLTLRNVAFCILTSSQSSGFSKTLKNTAKTDKADARNLYWYGNRMQPELTVIDSPDTLHKKQLFKYLTTLREQKQAFSNRLHALNYEPNACQDVIVSTKSVMTHFDEQIQIIENQLFNDENSDLEESKSEEIKKRIQTVVGIGNKTAVALLTATNNLKNFETVKSLAKFLGLCPTNRQSGTSVKGKGSISPSANGYVRKCLYMGAKTAIRYNVACKEFYEKLRATGKCYRVAMIAVAHKLLRQAFAVIKNQTDFQNNFVVSK